MQLKFTSLPTIALDQPQVNPGTADFVIVFEIKRWGNGGGGGGGGGKRWCFFLFFVVVVVARFPISKSTTHCFVVVVVIFLTVQHTSNVCLCVCPPFQLSVFLSLRLSASLEVEPVMGRLCVYLSCSCSCSSFFLSSSSFSSSSFFFFRIVLSNAQGFVQVIFCTRQVD